MSEADRSETRARLPQELLDQIADYHAGGISPQDCLACSSPCCAHGGFAILENVIEIYERYRRGKLQRTDYSFLQNLTFREFVLEYFDVYRHDVPDTDPCESIVLFHMRSLSPDGHTISIPPVATVAEYCRARNAFFEANAWMNTGCVFLSHKLSAWPNDDHHAGRHCILHETESSTQITAKPIDCVFHTCNTPKTARQPTSEQSDSWLAALARQYPRSVERFRELVDK